MACNVSCQVGAYKTLWSSAKGNAEHRWKGFTKRRNRGLDKPLAFLALSVAEAKAQLLQRFLERRWSPDLRSAFRPGHDCIVLPNGGAGCPPAPQNNSGIEASVPQLTQ